MTAERYRSIFHTQLPADQAFAAANGELRAWLGSKKLDQDAFDRGNARIGGNALLLVQARNSPDGTQTKRWQLRESLPGGAWVTTFAVHAPGRSKDEIRSWFWLDVEFVPGSVDAIDEQERSPTPRASVPRLARLLLDSVDARDSLAQLTQKPILTRPGDVDHLIDVICEPERRMPVIVASAHPRSEFEIWRDTIERATRYTAGLASLFLLDPHASERFNQEIGDTHGVWGGAVRTYLPGADPASVDDGLRHRVLSASRIELDTGRAAGLLSGLPRRLSAEGRLPRPLAGLNRTLLTGEAPLTHSASTDEVDDTALREEVRQLRENLSAALELVAEAERTEERLAQRNEDLQVLSADFDAANQRAEFLHDRVRSLQRRLIRVGHDTEAYAPAEEQTVLPTSFAEVLDRLVELPRIEFTGNVNQPLTLDDMPHSSSWAQTAWQAVTAMNAYADASARGSFAGSFVSWCKESPSGEHAFSYGKVAPDESDTVKNDPKMRHARMLPVPEAVASSRKVFMGAHVRLGGGAGMSAPRMHYFDDVNNTGKIYIGYLGPHLRVKSTN